MDDKAPEVNTESGRTFDRCTGCIAISRGLVETWRCHACTRNPELRDRYESEETND